MIQSSPLWDFFRELPAILRRPVYLGAWSTPAGKRERVRKRTLARQRRAEAVRGSTSSSGTRQVEGLVSAGKILDFSIDGIEFAVAEDAWIIGKLEPGCIARVRIPPSVDDRIEVSTVTVLQAPRI